MILNTTKYAKNAMNTVCRSRITIIGRDYEASCFAAATCGFGMGATPNAMANIQAVNKSFGPSPRALFVVPLVGSLFIDFFNSIVITTFLNMLG